MNIHDLLSLLSKSIRSVPAGRLLLTHWDESDAKIVSEQIKALGQEPIVISAEQTSDQESLNAVIGEFLDEIEASNNQFSIGVVPGHLVETYYKNGDKRAFQAEMQHAKKAIRYLETGGLLFMTVRRKQVELFKSWVGSLMRLFSNMQAFNLTDEIVVIVGVRAAGVRAVKRDDALKMHRQIVTGQLPSYPTTPTFSPPIVASDKKLYIRSKYFDPDSIDKVMKSIPWEEKRVMNDVTGWARPAVTPAFRLRAKHLASLISSGVMGTITLKSPLTGDECVIRGVASREFFENIEGGSDDKPDSGETVKGSTIETSILVLNIDKKTLTVVDPHDGMVIKTFLEEWGSVLMNEVERTYPVVYDPLVNPYTESFHPFLANMIDRQLSRSAKKLGGSKSPSLTIPQRHTIATALRVLLGRYALKGNRGERNDTGRGAFFLQGEKGVGKSMMGARILEGLVLEYKHRNKLRIGYPGWPITAMVTVPANLKEMAGEIRKASDLLDPVIVKNLKDLQNAIRRAKVNPKPVCLVIPRTMLSVSQRLEPAYVQSGDKFHHLPSSSKEYDRLLCPTCANVVSHEIVQRSTGEKDVYYTKADLIKSKLKIRGKKCNVCEGPLWQETSKGGYQMAAVAKKLMRKARVKPLAIGFDEIHEDRAGNSTRGQAMAWFADLFDKSFGLTGTLYGGIPSSLFHLFYRMIPEFRESWNIDDVSSFIRRYGNWKRYFNKRKDRWGRLVEMAGISPLLMAGFVINYSVFLTLADSGFDMPNRSFIPGFNKLSELEMSGLNGIIDEAKANLIIEEDPVTKHKKMKVRNIDQHRLRVFPVGMHLPQFISYSPAWICSECKEGKAPFGNCPHEWGMGPAEPGSSIRYVLPILDPDFRSEKERALIEVVQKEKEEGRPCLIYVYNTGPDYQIDKRLEFILGKAELKVLNVNKVPSEKIQKKINAAGLEGFDAVLVNPNRVGTGTNLIGMPTVIFYQPIWSPTMTSQAGSRSYRPTQKRSVRVYFMITSWTPEENILGKVLEKIVAMEFVAGGDTQGMAAILDAVGHQESFEQMIFNYVQGERRNDLSALFAAVEDAFIKDEDEVLIESEEDNDMHEVIEAIPVMDLSKATQLSLFDEFYDG